MKYNKITLAKLLRDNKSVNNAEERYISFIVNTKPDTKWNYKLEAELLFNLLTELEKAGYIK